MVNHKDIIYEQFPFLNHSCFSKIKKNNLMPPEKEWLFKHFSQALNCKIMHSNSIFFMFPHLCFHLTHIISVWIKLIFNEQKVAKKWLVNHDSDYAYLINIALFLNIVSLICTASHLVLVYILWFGHLEVCWGLCVLSGSGRHWADFCRTVHLL